ncbi:helix-turn-helix domain-containing protein [Streptomyces leeuwenhoekii]|uniref:LuxR Family Transcriptional Regulator n=4 Tax=Streptomyces leeuwenhoekii TaxID=1437453 RepID=A0A0F7VR24_STRLW|nr:helix-turn-helix transcriptional regulator [Streptomyces leeuwenhoekii]CQR59947.1 LuxR Family Transcriptional Regulator [Streptomyces leeuwenhoekii]
MTGDTTTRTPRIPGDSAQRRAVDALLDRLRAHSTALLLTGEPGLGRTSLLRWAARSFTAGTVLHLTAGPGRPAAAPPGAPYARITDGTGAGALLGLLRSAAGDRPLLVCADDAHRWSAPARAALGGAAERLDTAGRVGLLVTAAGYRAVDPEFARLPLVRLDPLGPSQAAALLDEVTDGAADPAVRDELLAEAEGNPALLRALLHRLSSAELHGLSPLPRPPADAATLARVAGEALTRTDPDTQDLLLTVAAAVRASDGADADAALVRRALGGLRPTAPGPALEPPPEPLALTDGRLGFHSDLVRRAVYAGAEPGRRRAAHRALARELEAGGRRLPALLHRAWSLAGPAPGPAARLAECAADPAAAASHRLRSLAYTRAAELTADLPRRAERYTAAAEQALLEGRPDRARPLLAEARATAVPAAVRGRAELVRGLTELGDGPVGDAHQSLLLAASLLAPDDPGQAATATLAAADAAWAAGDLSACLAALGHERGREAGNAEDRPAAAPGASPAEERPHDTQPPDPVHHHRLGLRAVLEGNLARAAGPLGHLVGRAHADHRPDVLLRSAAAALLLGDVEAARRAGARALAAARGLGSAALVPQALEYLAYAELRAGRHAQARAHAEEGLRAARRTGQRNAAAHHHAVLALAASIEEEPAAAERHAAAALATARRHGLVQAATLAEWAAARVDLGRGRPLDAADRLGLLVLPGPRRGHFAVWRLAVPCFVEAAVLAGRHQDARTVLEDFAEWAAFGADPQAGAQLARCHALLAPPDRADGLYRRALALHDDTAGAAGGGDFERARTALLYGKWLRRRRRPREARDRLGTALAGFDRCGAGVWAQQTRGELRALGAASHGTDAGALTRLTPQQLRIARYVAQGATNREVALSLAVSTRTVDYHLRKVFAVLGVRSRVELARMVEQAEKAAAQP